MEQNTTKALNLNRICQTNDQTNECNARHKTYNSAEKLNAIQMNFEHKPKIAGHSYRASKSTCACQALIISSKKKEKKYTISNTEIGLSIMVRVCYVFP